MATEKKQATKAAETKEEKMKKSTVEKAAEGTTYVDEEKKKTKTAKTTAKKAETKTKKAAEGDKKPSKAKCKLYRNIGLTLYNTTEITTATADIQATTFHIRPRPSPPLLLSINVMTIR